MNKRRNLILASAVMVASLLLTVGLLRKDEALSEPGEPFHVTLPVPNPDGRNAEVAGAAPIEPEERTGMSYADDVSDMHEPTLAPDFNPRTLHGKIRSEPRDEAWASQSEENLKSAVADIVRDRPGIDVRISCASTLCEARGLIRSGPGSAEAASVINLMQNSEMVGRLAKYGQGFVIISSARRPDGTAFFLYSRRIP